MFPPRLLENESWIFPREQYCKEKDIQAAPEIKKNEMSAPDEHDEMKVWAEEGEAGADITALASRISLDVRSTTPCT